MIDNHLTFRALQPFKQTPVYLVLHHEAGQGSVEDIHRYHLSLGWNGIAYHAYVRRDGSVYAGRPMDRQGGHTAGYNGVSIGICFEGNFETETMSTAQLVGGVKAIEEVLAKYPHLKIVGHRELTATACPGKNFPLQYFKQYEEEETMTRDQILAELGDQYIERFDQLPDWAKPVMREMLDRGVINGGTDRAVDPDDINMFLSDIKTVIINYRACHPDA